MLPLTHIYILFGAHNIWHFSHLCCRFTVKYNKKIVLEVLELVVVVLEVSKNLNPPQKRGNIRKADITLDVNLFLSC